jgi:MtN3 and saliva related transmembrane protein
MSADVVGMLAGLFTTAAFLPQAWRIWRTRSTRDLSLLMYAVFTAGVGLWFAYGIMIGALPIIITNGVTLLLSGAILAMKLRFG